MKLRKVSLILVITIAMLMIASIFSASYAKSSSPLRLSIKKLHSSGYAYQTGVGKQNIMQMWKIAEVYANGDFKNNNKTIYCLRGGPGFGSAESMGATIDKRDYTINFNMKKPSDITGEYRTALKAVLPNENSVSEKYKSLIWLLNNIYVAPTSNPSQEQINNAKEFKEMLLKNAGIDTNDTNDTNDTKIDDSEIDVVQQLAIWYFTGNDSYKVVDKDSNGDYTFSIDRTTAISDVTCETYDGIESNDDCKKLFNYLVKTANSMGKNYVISAETATNPYKLDKTLTIEHKTVGNNYIIGPFKINKISDTAGTLTAKFYNENTEIMNPTMQDVNGKTIATIEDTVGKEFYISIPTSAIDIEKGIKLEMGVSYFDTELTYWSVAGGSGETDQPVVEVERTRETYNEDITYTPAPKQFDLALRKFITSINGKAPAESREPKVDLTTLKNGTFNRNGKKEYTATYTHPKNALEVKTGDKVIYTIRVYNEGEADAYVKEVTDYLPDGLKLAENSTINTENGWTNPSKDGKTIVTSKLGKTLLKAFNGTTLEYLDVQIECEVTARGTSTKSLKNIAEITAHSDSEDDTTVTDRDSTPNDVNRNTYGTISQEDDDDYEQLIIVEKKFDLALRKFITAVGKKELVDENGKYIREPKVDVTPLLNNETTAIYEHSKTAVSVDVGDEVTYTLRVYNEGETDGYADEITDYLPEWLEFVNDEFNAQYGWKVSEDGRKVSTTITSKTTDYSASRDTIYANRTQEQDKVLLKAFDKTKKELDYIDVKIKCKVKDTGIAKKITNIAEITKASDDRGNTATDIDSKTNNITLPKDDVLPNYKDDEIESGEKYIPGQEDDDDFEKVIVQKFDLSLRKFITAVNSTEITERVPVFSMDSEKKFTYTHPKTPVEVVNGDVIVYTLRVYNEGNQAGYADEVKDNLPEGLVYLPENEINKEYRWKLYKEDGTETTEVSEAKTVRTDYLSRDQEIQTKRNNLLKAFNTETMTQPDYRDVKIAFKVTEPNTSDRIIINTAEISKDSDDKGNSVEDIDSTPDNDKEDEDDIDIEKVKVKYFDLALEKIVSEYSIKQNGKTTVTKTGHKFGVQPEPPVKVELVNSMVKSAVIKFKYQIKVTNEGEIAGYAEEVKDYIPSGLKFVKEDNSKWTMLEDGNTVTTDQLKDKLLQPGESAVVEITLQWINGQNNFGLKQNWAEISKDKNDSDSPDIDSVPNNKKEGEDDIDDASVLLSVKTGSAENYIVITGCILAIVSAGIVLIKKFVI